MTLASKELVSEVRQRLEDCLDGEIGFDRYSRVLYSTDASNHQIEPLGVVFPRNEEDLYRVVEIASELGVPIIPRGAGTSIAGQAVGKALVIDCSRYLDQIFDIDPDSATAEVAAGVVLDKLNNAAEPYGLNFGPDPASSSQATFGGMIGNNASGSHSVRYGMTSDHLISAKAILSDGSSATFEPMAIKDAHARAIRKGLEGEIYGQALCIREAYADAVRSDWPRTWRRASGYSLNYLVGYSPSKPAGWYAPEISYPPQSGINLAALMCGSEGTLAIIKRARVRLVPTPAYKALVTLSYSSIASACDATMDILESHPSAVEIMPRGLLQKAKQIPRYARKLGFVDGTPEALLVVEYVGDSLLEVKAACESLKGNRAAVLLSREVQEDFWQVRKVGLELLMKSAGDVKHIPFVEDVAVPIQHLAEYVQRVDDVLAEHGTKAEWYAHASAGCLHMRPAINLKTEEGVKCMRDIAEEIIDIVSDVGGVQSGEHGDGLSRSEFNSRIFGPKITQAFREIKQAFDPHNLLNPGKVITVSEEETGFGKLDKDLRYGPHYRARSFATCFAYNQEVDFAHAVEMCNGAALCRKDNGWMCPSFQATRNERDSTRGRANALRAALSGSLPESELTSREMYEVLDLCMECKSCKAECASGVDMARIKAEFLHNYQSVHGVPLRSRFFGEIGLFLHLIQPFAGIVNFFLHRTAFRWLLDKTLGITRYRSLPTISSRSFRRWFAEHTTRAEGDPVLLFVDTFTNAYYPETGIAAVNVLEAAGYKVIVAKGQVCCGRPMISKGLLERARKMAERNLTVLTPFAEQGIPIIGLEPSCLVTLRDEYLEFFPDDWRSAAVAKAARMIDEFMVEPGDDGRRPIDRLQIMTKPSRILVHGHCYMEASSGIGPSLEMLRATGAEVKEIEPGCCGLAGSFGYEREHYELSMKVGEMIVLPAVRKGVAEGAEIAASGVSCRAQILEGASILARHPIELLADCIRTTD